MTSRESLLDARHLFRHSRLGAWLTGALLSPPEPCYKHEWPGHEARPIGWNLYRCLSCATRREPERWWHLFGWKITRGHYDPFGRSERGRKPW